MQSEDTKKRLIDATKELLFSTQEPGKITARQIAAKAEVNLAMINYCFQSKEKLLKIAIDEIVAAEFQKTAVEEDSALSPKERLKRLLCRVSEVTLQFERITRLSIPYQLLEAPIELPMAILPYVKEHFSGSRPDSYCKMAAYELVTVLQTVLYRKKDFAAFSGIPLTTNADLSAFIDSQVELFLP